MFRITPYLIIVFAMSLNPNVVIADEDSKHVEELVGRVKALEIEITEIKKTIESLKAS